MAKQTLKILSMFDHLSTLWNKGLNLYSFERLKSILSLILKLTLILE